MLKITALIGLFAALVMFSGDMLLYFTKENHKMNSTLESYAAIMQNISSKRLFIGGLLGPIAAFFYCIGYYHMVLVTVDSFRIWGYIVTALMCFGIIVGGAYHAQFVYLGFLSKTKNLDGMDTVMENIALLSKVSTIPIAIGSLILFILIIFQKTSYPIWFVIFTPAILFFLSFVFWKLPQPFRIVLAGGWNNLLFVVFFLLSFLLS